MDQINVGRYLSELRTYYKITPDALANHLAASEQDILLWESGKATPDIDQLLKLSELYGVTINDIVRADITKINFQKEILIPGGIRPQKKITVIGCGRWGTCIAWYLDRIGHDVTLYGRASSRNLQTLMETRKNEYLTLSDTVKLTSELDAVDDSSVIVISIGSQKLYEIADQLAARNIRNKHIVLCMKGIEIRTGRRLSQVVMDAVDHSNKVAVWIGPGHVQEFFRGVPNCMVIDSTDELTKDELIKSFSSELIRFYYGKDLIGNEIGAAAKNVIGIAAGMLEGLDMASLKGALMTRGTLEIARLIGAMGGDERSAYGLCHLGDYEATLFSEHSQNKNFGKSVVQGTGYSKLAEGYYTVKALRNLGKTYGVSLPICEAIYQVLYENWSAKDALDSLFARALTNEF